MTAEPREWGALPAAGLPRYRTARTRSRAGRHVRSRWPSAVGRAATRGKRRTSVGMATGKPRTSSPADRMRAMLPSVATRSAAEASRRAVPVIRSIAPASPTGIRDSDARRETGHSARATAAWECKSAAAEPIISRAFRCFRAAARAGPACRRRRATHVRCRRASRSPVPRRSARPLRSACNPRART